MPSKIEKPPPGRYVLYKQGTTKIINFLKASTGNVTGQQRSTSGGTPSKQKAKSKGAPSKQTSTSNEPPRTRVRAIEEMGATIMSSSDSEVEIPVEIIVILEEVIKGRMEFAAFWSHFPEKKEDNRKHKYFIDVLEQLHDGLQDTLTARLARDYEKKHAQWLAGELDKPEQPEPWSLVEKRKARPPIEQLESQKDAILANIFEHLTLEEGAAEEEIEFDEGPPEPFERQTPKKAAQPSAPAPRDSESEAMFALWCFFMDMLDIRNYLYDVWTDYYVGNLSLMIAAETTNIAFTLILKTEIRLTELFPKVFRTYATILNFLGLKVGYGNISTGVSIDDASQRGSGAEDIEAGFQIQALFGMHAFRICEDFLVLSPRGKGATREHREFILNNAERRHPFAGMLYDLLPDITILAVRDNGLKMDMFTSWLVQMYQSGNIIPSIVVAMQVNMMIYDILGEENYHFCFQHLRLRGEEAKRMLDDRLALGEQLWVKADRARPLLLHQKEQIDNFISEDWIAKQRSKQKASAAAHPIERHRLFRSLPLLCGHQIFEMQIFLHINGIQNSTFHFCVLAAAYFYQAARLTGLKTKWTDMEFVIEKHSRPGAFIFREAESSTPLASMAKQYFLALGVPLQMLKQSGAMEATTELIIPALPHNPKLLQKTRQLEVELPFLAEMMKENERGGHTGWMDMTESALTRIALHLEGSSGGKALGNQPKAAHSANKSIVDLLHALRQSLATSEADMNFKYLEFWKICSSILEECMQGPRTEILRMQAAGIPVTLDYQVVTAILWQAAYAEKSTNTLQLGDTWLAQATRVFDAALAKHNPDKLSTTAIKTCGRHMAEAWKPINRSVRKPNAYYGDVLSVPPGLVELSSPEYEAEGALTRFDGRTSMLYTRYLKNGKFDVFTHRHIAPGTAASARPSSMLQ